MPRLPDPTQSSATIKPDGRRVRGDRAKQSVLDALWGLLHEGELRPPAQRIAQRAGVSLRLLYHHFADLETIFSEMVWRQIARMQPLLEPIAPAQPIAARIEALIERRAELSETITPVRRAGVLNEPSSSTLSGSLNSFRAQKRAQVEALFASELASCPDLQKRELGAALGAAASFAAWDLLRAHLRLSIAEAKQVTAVTLGALLQQTPAGAALDPAGVCAALALRGPSS